MVREPVYCRRFIGRRQQWECLSERHNAAIDGRGSLALISGEPGAGKSRLATEFCNTIAGSGKPGPSVVGCCFEFARSPFAPFRAIVQSLLAQNPGALDESPEIRDALSSLLPGYKVAAQAQPVAAAQRDKLAEFEALVQALLKLSSSRATIMVVEDLHWADVASLEFLQYAVGRLATSRILLIATFRPEELRVADGGERALAQLERSPAVWRLNLDPLAHSEMQQFLYHALDGLPTVSGQTLVAISNQAEGNPLFAEELLKSVIDKMTSREGMASLPASLRAAVSERWERMQPDDQSVLSHAAIFGRRFHLEFIAGIIGKPTDELLPVLKRARDLQLITEETEDGAIWYNFRHALTREAVYSMLLASEARPIHAKIAATIESSPHAAAHVDQLAYHWWKAGDRLKAVRYNELAGDAASRVFAFHDAATFYQLASDSCIGAAAPQPALLEKLADALAATGRGDGSRCAYDAALARYESAGDSEKAARVLLSLIRLLCNVGDIDAAFECAYKALSLAQSNSDRPGLFAAQVRLARLDAFFRSDVPAALVHLGEAQRYAPDASEVDKVFFYECRASVRAMVSDWQGAEEDIGTATRVAIKRGDFQSVVRCLSNFAGLMAQFGRRSAALDSFERAFDVVRDKRLLSIFEVGLLMQYANASLLYGELQKARELVERALSANVDMPRFQLLIARAGIPTALQLDDEQLLRRCLNTDLIDFAFQSVELASVAATSYSEYFLAEGDEAKARALLHRAVEALSKAHPDEDDYALLVMVAAFGEQSDIMVAESLMKTIAQKSKAPSTLAFVAVFKAYVARRSGDTGRATEKALEAAERFRDLQWPWHEAQALELAGHHADALEIYRRIGDSRDARRLDAMPAPMRRRTRGRVALTAREEETAALVRQGLSNRAIADRLVISERTVESHVASILAKLGVKSRAQMLAKGGGEGRGA